MNFAIQKGTRFVRRGNIVMKLSKNMALKVQEHEKEICKELGNDFYSWVTDPETEIRDYSVIEKIMTVLKKCVK